MCTDNLRGDVRTGHPPPPSKWADVSPNPRVASLGSLNVNGTEVMNPEDLSNGFNSLFKTKIGTEFASKIYSNDDVHFGNFRTKRNDNIVMMA